MNEERLMILQTLAGGKISVEEADILLRALEETAAPAGEPQADPAGTAAPRAERADLGRGPSELVRQSLEEADRALDEAVRTVEEKLAQQERREPYRQIRRLADSLDMARGRTARVTVKLSDQREEKTRRVD